MWTRRRFFEVMAKFRYMLMLIMLMLTTMIMKIMMRE